MLRFQIEENFLAERDAVIPVGRRYIGGSHADRFAVTLCDQ
jgi:hypothetical protein